MEKIDLREELKSLYSPKTKPEIVDVPECSYLTYTWRGEPGEEAYSESLNALYVAAYTLKFSSKKKGRDLTIMALEGVWWWDKPVIINLEDAPPRDTWNWTSIILVPDYITVVTLDEMKPELVEKKGKSVEKVRLERIHEGRCA